MLSNVVSVTPLLYLPLPCPLQAKVSVGLSAHSVDFSPDASHLAVGGVDGAVRVLLVEEMTTAVAQVGKVLGV